MTPNWSVLAELKEPRGNHTATLLGDGRILLAGGTQEVTDGSEECGAMPPKSLATVEIISPGTRETQLGPALTDRREQHYAATLGDGGVIIAGGCIDTG